MMRPDGPAAEELGSRRTSLEPGEKLVVLVGGVMASLAITAIAPVLPTIDRALAHTATDAMLVKQLVGGVILAMVVGAPLGGFLIGRVGMRSVLLVASLVYALAGTAGFYLGSLPALLASRLLLGAAAATIQVTSMVLVNTRLAGNARARWMGLHIAAATFSTLIINPLSGFIGSFDWRYPFIEYLFGLVLFAAMLGRRDHTAPPTPAEKQVPERATAGWSGFPWHYLLLSFLVGAVAFIPAIYLPFLLRDEAGLSPRGIAGFLTITALTGGTVAFLYGRIRTVLSTHAVFLLSFGLVGIGTLVMGFVHGIVSLIAGGLVYAIGNASLVANMMTALGAKVGPALQGRAAGLVKSVHFVSAPLSVIAIEPFARAYGPATAMRVASALAFFVVVLMLARIARPGHAQPTALPPTQPAAARV